MGKFLGNEHREGVDARRQPGPIADEAESVRRHNNPPIFTKPHYIVKFIPVAIVKAEYRQHPIPKADTAAGA